MNKVPATVVALAVPFEAVYFTHWPMALYDQAGAVRFGPLWRMAHVRGHMEDGAFLEVDAVAGTVCPQAQISVAAHLRSVERRVGEVCVSMCSSRCSTPLYKIKTE